ncbi:MAG TPA: histidinol-phosphatase HisJ family protein [Desulfobulbaceae bacterium]|nr:histidinol-phosphatase HisJ family protein [Desulfobulbaceae bacterium]
MEEYIISALTRGLHRITFLEHLEVAILSNRRTWLRPEDFGEYFRQGRILKKKYGDRIDIELGVEAGFNPEAIEELKQQLTAYPWDTIGLSYHFYAHNSHHYNMVSRKRSDLSTLTKIGTHQVMEDYFNGLLHALHSLDCDKICHLDAVLRHSPDLHFSTKHWQLIDELLLLMRKKGTMLEINTSGFVIRNEPYPCKRIIDRAITLGIPLVVGSDAHHPDQVGRFFDRLDDWFEEHT